MTAYRIPTNVVVGLRPIGGRMSRSRSPVRSVSTTVGVFRDAGAVLTPAGAVLPIHWTPAVGATSYDVEVLRLNNDGTESLAAQFTTVVTRFNWQPTKAGSYAVRVRGRASTPFQWIRSDNPVFATVNGAARGWWVLVYVAPASGGGIS